MNKKNYHIIFSFMVISHNQQDLLERCFNSILKQLFYVPWEVVVSDDNSTDNSWHIIQQYAKIYSKDSRRRADGTFIPQFQIYQINSSNFYPTVTSDRCAANKANVYMHARGKYCVNVDSDDFIIGVDNYQYQINQLEKHPECSLAMQNFLFLQDGASPKNGTKWWPDNFWQENEIIDIEHYCNRRLFISNQAFVMRRDCNLDPMKHYGLLFDDPIITMHHLNQGHIICSQRVSYVHVQYSDSIWNQVASTDNEILRLMTPLVVYLRFFKNHSISLVRLELVVWIQELKKYCKKETQLNISVENKKYVERLGCILFNDMIARSKSIRAYITLYLCKFINKFSFYNRYFINCLLFLIE